MAELLSAGSSYQAMCSFFLLIFFYTLNCLHEINKEININYVRLPS